ncbi:MAG: DUF4433 domain-containing protein, partial [Deltaproteobacteria bacterium]|nr:DUF4433 domain-containing protein [Deltaproteobacteria bacterium]
CMKRSDLHELHYITPILNVPSIMNQGILSHQKARQLNHASVAMQEVQDIRSRKRVPGGLLLHAYVNLYFCARNPMMRKRAPQHLSLCVLQVNVEVLDIPNVVIADGNAASDYTAFWLPPAGLERVDFDLVFAEWWTDSNQIEQWHKARVKCAEVLVPDRVDPRFIQGAYVSFHENQTLLEDSGFRLPVTVNPKLFFQI